MRRLIPCLLLLGTVGCGEASNELVAPLRPTPAPSPIPPPSYRIDGTVTRNGHGHRTTVTATSGGRRWTTTSGYGSGAYQFRGLPAGDFEVSASIAYCGTQRKSVTVPPNATVDFRFLMCWRVPDDPQGSDESAAAGAAGRD